MRLMRPLGLVRQPLSHSRRVDQGPHPLAERRDQPGWRFHPVWQGHAEGGPLLLDGTDPRWPGWFDEDVRWLGDRAASGARLWDSSRTRRSARRILVLPAQPRLAERLIDCEEDRTLRALLVGMPRK